MNFRLSDLERRVAGLINVGRVADLDEQTARVRVEFGEILTDWLPWLTTRAGADRTWWAPEPGEQVLILAPSGELAQAVVLPALYRNDHPPPGNTRTQSTTVYADGTRVTYDRDKKELSAHLAGSATVNVTTDTELIVGANVVVNVTGTAKVNAQNIALNGGVGVVTGECICHFTGKPHGDVSSTVTAGK